MHSHLYKYASTSKRTILSVWLRCLMGLYRCSGCLSILFQYYYYMLYKRTVIYLYSTLSNKSLLYTVDWQMFVYRCSMCCSLNGVKSVWPWSVYVMCSDLAQIMFLFNSKIQIKVVHFFFLAHLWKKCLSKYYLVLRAEVFFYCFWNNNRYSLVTNLIRTKQITEYIFRYLLKSMWCY